MQTRCSDAAPAGCISYHRSVVVLYVVPKKVHTGPKKVKTNLRRLEQVVRVPQHMWLQSGTGAMPIYSQSYRDGLRREYGVFFSYSISRVGCIRFQACCGRKRSRDNADLWSGYVRLARLSFFICTCLRRKTARYTFFRLLSKNLTLSVVVRSRTKARLREQGREQLTCPTRMSRQLAPSSEWTCGFDMAKAVTLRVRVI